MRRKKNDTSFEIGGGFVCRNKNTFQIVKLDYQLMANMNQKQQSNPKNFNEFVYSRLIEIHSKQIKTIEMHIVYFNATVVAAAEPSII